MRNTDLTAKFRWVKEQKKHQLIEESISTDAKHTRGTIDLNVNNKYNRSAGASQQEPQGVLLTQSDYVTSWVARNHSLLWFLMAGPVFKDFFYLKTIDGTQSSTPDQLHGQEKKSANPEILENSTVSAKHAHGTELSQHTKSARRASA